MLGVSEAVLRSCTKVFWKYCYGTLLFASPDAAAGLWDLNLSMQFPNVLPQLFGLNEYDYIFSSQLNHPRTSP